MLWFNVVNVFSSPFYTVFKINVFFFMSVSAQLCVAQFVPSTVGWIIN